MTSQVMSKQVGDTVTVCVRMSRANYERLRSRAGTEHRTISNMINVIVLKDINQE